MKHFLWMHPWDLEGWEPEALLDELAATGIDEVRLALAYHGGRFLLPRHRSRLVYELPESDVYFYRQSRRYSQLIPAVGPQADAVHAFLSSAEARRFPVRAWLVLCHNERLGRQHPNLCIRNFRGEPYTYALCPAQPEVQAYVRALVAEVSQLPGIRAFDLEALSFLGYEHNSLHDKRAIPAAPALDLCHCPVCRGRQDRPAILASMLDQIRQATSLPVDLRYTDNLGAHGPKSYLHPADLLGRVASVTWTSFGQPSASLQPPPSLPVPVHAGLVFHPPDTNSQGELLERYLAVAEAASVGFYCYGLASAEHWSWLRALLGRLR